MGCSTKCTGSMYMLSYEKGTFFSGGGGECGINKTETRYLTLYLFPLRFVSFEMVEKTRLT